MIAAVQEITQGDAESVLECVSSESAMATANSFALTEGNGIARSERLGMLACRIAAVTISIWVVYLCKTSPYAVVLPLPVLTQNY